MGGEEMKPLWSGIYSFRGKFIFGRLINRKTGWGTVN